MIPVLFSKGSNVFTSNGQGRLTDTTSCIVHEQRNGIFELEMEMPTAGIHFDDIEFGSIILAKPSPNRTAQPFRVYSIQKTMGDMMATICAEHIGYQLNMIPVMPIRHQLRTLRSRDWSAMQPRRTHSPSGRMSPERERTPRRSLLRHEPDSREKRGLSFRPSEVKSSSMAGRSSCGLTEASTEAQRSDTART